MSRAKAVCVGALIVALGFSGCTPRSSSAPANPMHGAVHWRCVPPPHERELTNSGITRMFQVCADQSAPTVSKREAIASARRRVASNPKSQSAVLVRLSSIKHVRYVPYIRHRATWIVSLAPSGPCLQWEELVGAHSGKVYLRLNLRANVPCY